jgi:ABC-type branched-subunit amino acid transport system ATPase component
MHTLAPEARARPADVSAGESMLSLKGVVAGYGGFDILHGIDLHVNRGEIVTVVGPNGSGKSTVFNAIYGLINVRRGEVVFQREKVTSMGPQDLLKRGLAMVPQLFDHLSVS